MMNKIYTDKEYLEQGFTTEELPMIRKHDELFNEYQRQFGTNWQLTEQQWEEYNNLVIALKL